MWRIAQSTLATQNKNRSNKKHSSFLYSITKSMVYYFLRYPGATKQVEHDEWIEEV